MYLDFINNYAKNHGLNINFRFQNQDNWSAVLEGSAYIPVVYSSNSIEFQLANQRSRFDFCEDLSMIINWNNRPVAIWPVSISSEKNSITISSQGMPILPPLFVEGCSIVTQKKIVKICLDLAKSLSIETNAHELISQELFVDSIGLSIWHSEAMTRGASCSLEYELFVNLQRPIDEIKKGFRKSFKSLITSGKHEWDVSVLCEPNEQVWHEFKNLHYSVSGRKTRSDFTWQIHFDDIKNKKGFLVYLRDDDGLMTGGGFFNFTRDEGLYSVGVYRRDLFDRPLGHVIQYQAIDELKKRGVRWYRLGARPYLTSLPSPSPKEISIGDFKQGFSSHLLPRYLLRHKIFDL